MYHLCDSIKRLGLTRLPERSAASGKASTPWYRQTPRPRRPDPSSNRAASRNPCTQADPRRSTRFVRDVEPHLLRIHLPNERTPSHPPAIMATAAHASPHVRIKMFAIGLPDCQIRHLTK